MPVAEPDPDRDRGEKRLRPDLSAPHSDKHSPNASTPEPSSEPAGKLPAESTANPHSCLPLPEQHLSQVRLRRPGIQRHCFAGGLFAQFEITCAIRLEI